MPAVPLPVKMLTVENLSVNQNLSVVGTAADDTDSRGSFATACDDIESTESEMLVAFYNCRFGLNTVNLGTCVNRFLCCVLLKFHLKFFVSLL